MLKSDEIRLFSEYVKFNDIMLFNFIICSLLFIAVVYSIYVYRRNKKWAKQPLRNFPFVHRGIEFWYSRSCAVIHFVFCQDKNGKWRVLANKRGDGTPDFQGLWNCPCGYLDFNEDGEKAAQRETYEECGVFVEKSNIKFVNVNTSPSDSRQNVGLRYVSILSGTIDQYVLTDENSEKREVKAIAWIPVEGIEEYKWAFGHEALVAEMYEYAINL